MSLGVWVYRVSIRCTFAVNLVFPLDRDRETIVDFDLTRGEVTEVAGVDSVSEEIGVSHVIDVCWQLSAIRLHLVT